MSLRQKVYPTDVRYDQLQDGSPVFPLCLSYQRPFSTEILVACLSRSATSALGLSATSLVRHCRSGPKPGSPFVRILQLCKPGRFQFLTRSFSSGKSFNHLPPTFASAGFSSDLTSVGGPGFCSSGACLFSALASFEEQGNAPANEPLPHSIRGGGEWVGASLPGRLGPCLGNLCRH